ncbi:hypothetical protein AB4450_12025 [Vibrio breoganii]
MKIGIFGTSLKANEKRIPFHPEHISMISKEYLKQMFFEEGYGKEFGFDINSIKGKIGGVYSREDLFQQCDTLILPKFSDRDNDYFREGQVIFGWPHCVQGEKITQTAIDKKLTLVAFEAMFSGDGSYKHHIFHKNNEIAGFASVEHSTQLRGITGYYGGKLKAVVFGFGSTARGAVHALQSQGISDITVFTKRPPHLIQQQIPGVKYESFIVSENKAYCSNRKPIVCRLENVDIIVNCVLQNPNDPITFIHNNEKNLIKRNAVIVDVSCDKGMGFDFAVPTSFDSPGFMVDQTDFYYYGVDHTPSLYWNTSSYELSSAILPFIDYICKENGFHENEILLNAVEIENGIIRNKNIIEFQQRDSVFPYNFK